MGPDKQPIRTVSPIGLDFGPTEIRAAQLIGSPEDFDIVRSAVLPRRDPEHADTSFDDRDASHLRELLARRGFIGNRVAICAPHGTTSAHIISLPARDSGAPINAIARAELARVRKTPPNSFEVAAWYMPSRGRSEQGLAVACDRAPLEERLTNLESAGFTTVAVDLEEIALARGCQEELINDPNAISAIVRIGWGVSLGVLALGEHVVYARRVEYGVSRFVADFRDRAKLPLPDALRMLRACTPQGESAMPVLANLGKAGWKRLATDIAKEIDTAVTYVSHAYRSATIGRVIIAGYGTDIPELAETLDRSLGMQTVMPEWNGAGPSMAIALGLARRFDQ